MATLVLSFVAIIGQLGDTGSNHFGYWSIGIVILGLFYGSPVGLVLGLILRAVLFKLPFNDFVVVGCEAGVVALIFGCLGGLNGPFLAALTCVGSFVLSTLIIGGMKLASG